VLLASLCRDEYNKVSGLDNAKQIWDTLKISHEGNDAPMITKMELVEGELGRFTMIRPRKQKLRKMSDDKAKGSRNKLKRLLSAGVTREVTYPEWLANTVMVNKSNEKWRMCIDFTDLNKACPKDEFPLPRIDSLIDAAATLELMSLLDCYSGYH
jgi:hypothetical protein